MAVKKSELYSSLWASCDELRGGMDASQYKDYVLFLLFVKYVSDKFAGKDYAAVAVPEGASFADMVALKGKSDIGDQINKRIVEPLARENHLSDLPDFNDAAKLGTGKEQVERLTNLIAIFENPALDFSRNRAEGDDLLGDAYEYLMRHFATESGKSKGQFYTPAEVSRVIALILGIRHATTSNETTAYDPTCGSGSLLLKVAAEASHGGAVHITLSGQEKDSSTAGLARMNMILHGYATADIKQGNTLANPLFHEADRLTTFDYAVANPPFSDKRWSTGLDPAHDPWQRFQHYGVPPTKQGDYAYLLHILRSLKPDGKGACILPHGVLFRGHAEAAIRRNLVQRGVIRGIIGLPANLFFGTGIPACILVLDKENAGARRGIFMLDASRGFLKDGPKNRLRAQDIHRIVDTFTRGAEVPRYSRMVPVAEISDPRNDYNLNLPRYLDSTEPEDIQDLAGHLRGGIPERDIVALEAYWEVLPGVRAALFAPDDQHAGYLRLRVPIAEIKPAIFGHAEFHAFRKTVVHRLTAWEEANAPRLRHFDRDSPPKALVEALSEDLLDTFARAPLLDHYDIYQHLMDYWDGTMQDDCYLIAADGWREAARPRLLVEDKGKKTRERPDLTVGKKRYRVELIPPALVIACYFALEQAAIEKLEADIAALQQETEELAEEHGGEGGLLEDAKNDRDKLTRASVAARLRELDGTGSLLPSGTSETEDAEERAVLRRHLALCDQETAANARLKAAQDRLTEQVFAQYTRLTEEDVKTLVVGDKWLAAIAAAVQGELERVSQTLTGRVRQLAERYAVPLPQLEAEVATLAGRVEEHLKEMGAVWK